MEKNCLLGKRVRQDLIKVEMLKYWLIKLYWQWLTLSGIALSNTLLFVFVRYWLFNAFYQYQKHQKEPLSKMESITDETNNHFVNDKDLEILVIASIQTLKRGNKKCGREEVYRSVNDSLNKDITRELLELILKSVIDNHSVNLNLVCKWECLFLPKGSY